ncbi:GNAT family N-acetyltransferase [Verrucomicrobium spinosum]|uniref:GNAT family N-acetyltransferase n=1 Tax=Verrucomicrobium spinosum TaxID=2736 RepID=UPI00155DC7C4|nr:GNAT family N-acetyltransferase [Verrucomicrobium spinosum]
MASDHLDIAAVADVSATGCDLVRQWLREHNWTANQDFMEQLQQPEHQARALVLLARRDARVVGGLIAETQMAWLRISIMAVSPECRSQGIGAALLAEAERLAVGCGCRHAYVDTMEYQEPRFYLAHRFSIVGQIPDWDSRGHAKLYFSKDLRGNGSSLPTEARS